MKVVVRDPEDASSPASAPLLVACLSLTQVSQKPSTILCVLGEIHSQVPGRPSLPAPTLYAIPGGLGVSWSAAPLPNVPIVPIPVSPRCEHSGLSIGQGVVGERG